MLAFVSARPTFIKAQLGTCQASVGSSFMGLDDACCLMRSHAAAGITVKAVPPATPAVCMITVSGLENGSYKPGKAMCGCGDVGADMTQVRCTR